MKPFVARLALSATALIFLVAPVPAAAFDVVEVTAAFSTLYKFTAQQWWPRGGLVMDSAGNLYGTTRYGGSCSTCGVVYKLAKPAPGGTRWTFSVLHQFKLGTEGIAPTAPLAIKGKTLYGTTSAGGLQTCGCGEVFKLTESGGKWTYQMLHRFKRSDGASPIGGVLVAADGTLYGTTSDGGSKGAGVVYRITAGGSFKVVHNFVGNGGTGPQGELLFGKDGAIYGTTYGAGKYNQGVVFRVTPAGVYKVLYDFLGVNQPGGSHDGAQPEGRLALAGNGTIYGTTSFGGTPLGYGTAWSLKPPATSGGAWTYQQIHIFGKTPDQPNLPHSGLVIDGAGNLFGAGAGGGTWGSGTLFKLTRPSSGTDWNATVLHSFQSMKPGGDVPYATLLFRNGYLYGTTLTGGTKTGSCTTGCGTVFAYRK